MKLRTLRIAAYILFFLLALAIAWRSFIHRPALVQDTAQSAPTAPSPLPAQMLTQSDLILDLFNPSSAALARQHGESAIKRQIEEAIVISFILRRCDLIGTTDYYDTYRALIAYAQRTNLAADATAATATIKQLTASANASYALLYSRTACSESALAPTAAKLADWRQRVLQPTSPE